MALNVPTLALIYGFTQLVSTHVVWLTLTRALYRGFRLVLDGLAHGFSTDGPVRSVQLAKQVLTACEFSGHHATAAHLLVTQQHMCIPA